MQPRWPHPFPLWIFSPSPCPPSLAQPTSHRAATSCAVQWMLVETRAAVSSPPCCQLKFPARIPDPDPERGFVYGKSRRAPTPSLRPRVHGLQQTSASQLSSYGKPLASNSNLNDAQCPTLRPSLSASCSRPREPSTLELIRGTWRCPSRCAICGCGWLPQSSMQRGENREIWRGRVRRGAGADFVGNETICGGRCQPGLSNILHNS